MYRSDASWTTWPSERRAMYGASLKPDPSYSPISSTPSASFGFSVVAPSDGGTWSATGRTSVFCSSLIEMIVPL
jgi:hypothetical protein